MTDSIRQTTDTEWRTVCAAIVAGIVIATHLGKVGPALPDIRQTFAGDLTTIGWIASIVSLVGATASILLGTLANRSNARFLAIGSLVLLTIASTLGAFASSPAALIGARTVEGFAIVLMAVSAPAIIGRCTTEGDRPFALALWSTYVPIGMTVGILIAVVILAAGSWRDLWLITSLITFGFLFIFVIATRGFRVVAANNQQSVADVVGAVTTPGPWLLSACFACYAFMWVTLITWMPSFLHAELAFSLRRAALATALMTFVNVIGNFAGAFWLKHGRSRFALIIVAMAVMAVFGWLSLSELTSTNLKIISGITFSMISGVIPAALIGGSSLFARRPDEVATANGVIVQGSQIGQLIGPPTAGAIAQAGGGFAATAVVFPLAGLIGAGLGVAIRRLEFKKDRHRGR